MNSEGASVREFGQLSLPSSFLLKPVSCSKNSNKEDVQTKPSKKNSCISLSDFLNRKLDKTTIPSKTVQRKQIPFSSLVEDRDTAGSVDEHIWIRREGVVINPLLNETVFEQFKQPRKEKEDCDGSSGRVGLGESTTIDGHESRKRRNPFLVSSKGEDERHTTPRHLVILGDDPKPKQKGRGEKFVRNKKPRPLFNHYANGSGWWDYNMEGIDDEEVGCSEAWEGMGSTTLGGLEWH